MLSINTNITSLLAMKSLNRNTNAMDIAMNRLSTGFRINSSKDDAAGSAISASLSKEISSFDVAQENAQMGQSMIDTASSTISNIQNMVERIRNLAVESANGTYGDEERKAMQNEVSSLLDEIYRIKETTEFNGKKLFGTNSIGRLTEETAEAMGYTVVKTADQLRTALQTLDAKVMLFDDIDLDDLGVVDGNNWTAVGTASNKFTGTLDGNGFTISNLKINQATKDYQGLFGFTIGATISNVNLENVEINGKDNIGGIAGYVSSSTTVTNCNVDGNISGSQWVGLVAGTVTANSTVENCNTSGSTNGDTRVGGVIGAMMTSTVINCSSSADAKCNVDYVGGIVGFAIQNSSIINCSSSGDIESETVRAGGIVGEVNKSFVNNCTTTSNVSGTNLVGGVTGYACNSSTIQNCTVSGDISGTQYIGGISGQTSASTISNCESSASVTGTNYVGGISGNTNSSEITNCKSSGSITGTGNYVGGISAQTVTSSSITNCESSANVNGAEKVGGISGTTSGSSSITDCDYSGNITATNSVGGISGEFNNSEATNCVFTGDISSDKYSGGIIGVTYNNSTVTDCGSYGNITATGTQIGGIVGANNGNGIVDNCVSSSTVTGAYTVGGLVGINQGTASVINSKTTSKVTRTGDPAQGPLGAVIADSRTNNVSDNEYNPTVNEGVRAIGTTATPPEGSVIANEDLVITPPEPKAHPERGVQKSDSKAHQNPDTTVKLQVGIGSDKSSNISVDTGFDLGRLVVDISTEKGATRAIGSMDKLMNELTTKQTELASASNRLQSAMEFQQVQKDSKIAMLSVIKDADIAKESSDYIKAQILQQTTASLLAQANQTPSIALRLLAI